MKSKMYFFIIFIAIASSSITFGNDNLTAYKHIQARQKEQNVFLADDPIFCEAGGIYNWFTSGSYLEDGRAKYAMFRVKQQIDNPEAFSITKMYTCDDRRIPSLRFIKNLEDDMRLFMPDFFADTDSSTKFRFSLDISTEEVTKDGYTQKFLFHNQKNESATITIDFATEGEEVTGINIHLN